MRTRRWIPCLVGCAASVSLTPWAGAQVAADPDVTPQKQQGTMTDKPAPRLKLETLRARSSTGQTADPFQARSWTPPADPVPPRRRAAPLKREPPPLPFTYLGRVVDGDTTVVMLAREHVNHAVRLGDTLDRDYRVARIGEDGVTLRYLPLNVDQTLSYRASAPATARPSPAGGRDDRAPAVTARAPTDRPTFTGALTDALANDLVLELHAPERAAIGQEFALSVGLGGDGHGASATVELAYDPAVLRALDGAAAAPTPSGAPLADPGRAVVDLVAPKFAGTAAVPVLMRFRVVAGAPTTTSVRVTPLSGSDADGRPVAIAAPAAVDVTVVPAMPR